MKLGGLNHGGAILLSQRGREPDDTEIRIAAVSAHKLYEEVKKQRTERQQKQPLPLVELAKEKSEGGY